MCICTHDVVSFGDQSAKAEKSRHLIFVTKANIWCASYGKMGYKHFDHYTKSNWDDNEA